MKVTLKRDITTAESGLDRDFKKGEELFTYSGPTYGCISEGGTAVTLVEDETPFFQLPHAALDSGIKEEPENDTDPYVGIKKLSHDMDEEFHPNGINEGYERGGSMAKEPTVGERFQILRKMGYFRTSLVTEIIETIEHEGAAIGGQFKTQNSTYSWGVITDKENYEHGNVTADQG